MPKVKGFQSLKSLFETPQKARLTVICALVALVTVGAVAAYLVYSLGGGAAGADVPPEPSEAESGAPAQSGDPAESQAQPSQDLMGIVPTLTIDEARELALADAGAAEDEAAVSREALSEDNGIWVYEFRFRTEEAQYEYKINANTGEVRSMVKEIFVYPSEEPSMPALESGLPAESAPELQPSPAPLPSEAPAASVPPPSAGPTPSPTDAPAPSPTPGQTTLYVGMDRAKAIALEHAGLSADQVMFTRTRMEREQGAMVYEIEFRRGAGEYKYKINAATGRILDHEIDAD